MAWAVAPVCCSMVQGPPQVPHSCTEHMGTPYPTTALGMLMLNHARRSWEQVLQPQFSVSQPLALLLCCTFTGAWCPIVLPHPFARGRGSPELPLPFFPCLEPWPRAAGRVWAAVNAGWVDSSCVHVGWGAGHAKAVCGFRLLCWSPP